MRGVVCDSPFYVLYVQSFHNLSVSIVWCFDGIGNTLELEVTAACWPFERLRCATEMFWSSRRAQKHAIGVPCVDQRCEQAATTITAFITSTTAKRSCQPCG